MHAVLGVLAAAIVTFAAVPKAYASNEDGRVAGFKGVPVEGSSARGPFTGTLDVERFEALGGQVVAVGLLSYVDADGRAQRQAIALALDVNAAREDRGRGDDESGGFGGQGALERDPGTRPAAVIRAPLRRILEAQVVCPVLGLRLQPVDVNLLGLVVHLNQVALAINAQQGQLLGNLVCAVAGLLDANQTAALASALNQIVNVLAGTTL